MCAPQVYHISLSSVSIVMVVTASTSILTALFGGVLCQNVGKIPLAVGGLLVCARATRAQRAHIVPSAFRAQGPAEIAALRVCRQVSAAAFALSGYTYDETRREANWSVQVLAITLAGAGTTLAYSTTIAMLMRVGRTLGFRHTELAEAIAAAAATTFTVAFTIGGYHEVSDYVSERLTFAQSQGLYALVYAGAALAFPLAFTPPFLCCKSFAPPADEHTLLADGLLPLKAK